jgi:hypothetical protein
MRCTRLYKQSHNQPTRKNNAHRQKSKGHPWQTVDTRSILTSSCTSSAAITKRKLHGFVNAALNQGTIENIIAFYHVSLFFPVLSTWCDAIDAGRFTTWPGLTSSHVWIYPPPSIAMHMGHLEHQRSNARSTQPRPTPNQIEPTPEDILEQQQDAAPPILYPPAQKYHHIYVDCQHSTGQLYTNLTIRLL